MINKYIVSEKRPDMADAGKQEISILEWFAKSL